MQKYGLRYLVLPESGEKFTAAYGVDGVPETFFISPRGHVLAANTGEMSKRWISETLNSLLDIRA